MFELQFFKRLYLITRLRLQNTHGRPYNRNQLSRTAPTKKPSGKAKVWRKSTRNARRRQTEKSRKDNNRKNDQPAKMTTVIACIGMLVVASIIGIVMYFTAGYNRDGGEIKTPASQLSDTLEKTNGIPDPDIHQNKPDEVAANRKETDFEKEAFRQSITPNYSCGFG